jgi:hypothetical protein
VTSGPGKAGDACQDTPGVATCGDGLACLQTSTAGGTCTPYCDGSHACPAGTSCQTAALGGASGPQFHVCVR